MLHAVLAELPSGEWLQSIGRIFRLLPTPLPFDALPSSYWAHIWYGITTMAGLQSSEGRMMIDSVVWAQYINVTDTHHNSWHTDSHVAIANAAPTHCVGRQKWGPSILAKIREEARVRGHESYNATKWKIFGYIFYDFIADLIGQSRFVLV